MNPGVYTALITPFTPQFELNEEQLRANIRFQIENGVDGIVVLGTTGETPTLTDKEMKRIIQIAKEEVREKVKLIIGTGSYSTRQTIENTKQAIDLGADAALVVTPYYNKPTQEGLCLHFEALAKAVKFPILLYNIQGRTGVNIQTDTLKRIALIPEIIGVKDSSGNLPQVMDIVSEIVALRSDFLLFSGDDNFTYPLLTLGGCGVISVISNLIPQKMCQLVHLALSGNYSEAQKLHYELLPLFKSVFLETNPIPIKAMMNFCGKEAGPCRLPLSPLSEENKIKLGELLSTHYSYLLPVEVYG